MTLSLSHLFLPRRAFRVCCGIGLISGIVLAMIVAARLGLSSWVLAAVLMAGLCMLLGAGMVAKILTGEESFVYLREIIPIFAIVAGILHLIHYPVLAYLDVTILCGGTFLAFGRVGCLLVGCCHGHPSRWGICYGLSHAECGFPSHYVGVRLFPIQAVESLFVFCLVAIGTTIVWKGAPPGTVLVLYLAAYAVGRLFIEFARGDAERPFLWNFSEAQWTSVLLLWAIVFAEIMSILPSARWHLFAAICLPLSMGVVAAKRRLDSSHRFELLHPYHVRELAQATRQIFELPLLPRRTESSTNDLPPVSVFRTSRGIQLSGGAPNENGADIYYYCLSSSATPLTLEEAQSLSRLIVLLSKVHGPSLVVPGKPGIFHLLLAPRPQSQ